MLKLKRMRFSVSSAFLLFASVTTGAAQVGTVNFPNSGAAAAQPSFLRGLALLHNFEYSAAAASFREAQRADPAFALAYWGEAMTYNHAVWFEQDRAAAVAVLRRLGATAEERLAKAPTAREKDWLHAVEVLYGDGAKESRDSAYAKVMAGLSAKYPEDPEAASFYALSLLGTAHGGRDIATYMRAASIVEEVFRDHPEHPGAVHYLIHSYDDPVHAPLGIRAARAYSAIAPDAGHAQHMTSHIFVAMGMWRDVVKANETAVAVVDAQRKATNQRPSACGHYNFWLEYGYLMQGRTVDAKRLLVECRDRAVGGGEAGHGGGPTADPDASLIGSLVAMRARYLIDTDDWTGDVANWSLPSNLARPILVSNAFLEGYGAIRREDMGSARSRLADLSAARRALEDDFAKQGINPRGPQGSFLQRAAILELELSALVAFGDGRTEDAARQLIEAATAEEAMPFEFGPPFIDKPTRELLGDVLFRAGRYVEALAAYEASLRRAPLRVPSLEGLAAAASASGNSARANEARQAITAMRGTGR